MWTLTPDNLERAKIELRRRRAAIEARYAEELKAVDTDVEEIETLERVAHSFSVKHLSATDIAPESSAATRAPVAVESEPSIPVSELEIEPPGPTASAAEAESQSAASGLDLPTESQSANAIAALRTSPEEAQVSPDTAPKVSSRWRIRVPSDGELA